MSSSPRFLLVDHHAESRFLLAKTLLRKFPDAVIRECDDAESAIQLARTEEFAVIIAHRTFDLANVEIVQALRRVDPRVPIVMVSGIDRTEDVAAAGADAFLLYDEWLRIGTMIEPFVAARRTPEAGESERKRRLKTRAKKSLAIRFSGRVAANRQGIHEFLPFWPTLASRVQGTDYAEHLLRHYGVTEGVRTPITGTCGPTNSHRRSYGANASFGW